MTQKKNNGKLGKKTREESIKTKKKILRAALKIFAREGFYNAKLRDIAAQAGTTHSLIRHHFGSKDDLWKAVVDYGLDLHINSLKKVLNSGEKDDPVKLYKNSIANYIKMNAKNPELSKILLHDNSRSSPHLDYLMERERKLHSVIEPYFEKVQEYGYFKGFDHDNFLIYIRALVETPIATKDITNRLLKGDILSKKGIAKHTERVLNFVFRKDDE
jgi:AcrR family transcriptional regulator